MKFNYTTMTIEEMFQIAGVDITKGKAKALIEGQPIGDPRSPEQFQNMGVEAFSNSAPLKQEVQKLRAQGVSEEQIKGFVAGYKFAHKSNREETSNNEDSQDFKTGNDDSFDGHDQE